MKKILIALLLVVSLFVATACGRSVPENNESTPDASATDASATDLSSTDVSATDAPAQEVIPAPEGYVGYEIGDLYLYYSDEYTAAASENALSVSADASTGANFSVSKSEAVDMTVSELSRTDLDRIGEKGAADLEAILGEGVDAVYTYSDHGTVLDGKCVYFVFDITVNYTDLEVAQTYNYYQMYIGEGKDLYLLTFATNTMFDDNAETYFAEVIESVELKTTAAE